MANTIEFNPIETARKIEESYREYIASTIHFADADLQSQLEEILHERGYLAKGPFLEAAPPYRKDKSVADLVMEGVLCRGMLKLGEGDPEKFDPTRSLYVHQVKAIRKAYSGKNYAVVTGTGSGKTECFLLPIFNDILSEFEQHGSSAGIRALILYPMNALANDQLKRLRQLLAGTDISFGRYTGDTEETEARALSKWHDENPGLEKLPNEVISREEIRKRPPNILLTNYSMLEYLLLRPEDAPLFGSAFGANWRHIAIDEAHVYSGALGTEIAFLLRRLKARIESDTGSLPKLRCYATSATIGSEEEMAKVAAFAQDLFGEPFESEGDDFDVVTSEKDQPQDALDSEPWGSLPLGAWEDLRRLLVDSENATTEAVRELFDGSNVPTEVLARMDGEPVALGLGKILLGEASAMRLVERCADLLDLTDLSRMEEINIEGLRGDEEGVRTLTAMVEVLSFAQRSADVPILSSRYHSFLRAPEGIFLNLATRRLTSHKKIFESYDGVNDTPVYEVSVCRHCGQAYVLGNEELAKEVPTAWLNPRHEGTDADDEFIPRTYYRLLADEAEKDPDEVAQWLCPVCGSLHHEKDGGLHRFLHEPVPRTPVALNKTESMQADEEEARCRHCGYQSCFAIQPMRVSPEAAGSVVCYNLVRDIPPFDKIEESNEDDWFADVDERRAGSVICFSDKRQDAAFFAPSMDRTYGNITRRQFIREAVEARASEDEGASPSSVINWMISVERRRYPGLLGADKRGKATAWILDELAAEDSRNSLEGLGLVRIEPTAFNEGFDDPKVKNRVSKLVGQLSERIAWLTEKDYVLLCKVCLELLRERDVIEVPEGVGQLRGNHGRFGNLIVLGGESSPSSKGIVQFAGVPTGVTENKRSAFIRKYAKLLYGVEVSRDESLALLQSLFGFLVQYFEGFFRGCGYLVGTREKFRLNRDIWAMYPHRSDDIVYRCDACGCETHLDTKGVCSTSKCMGRMQRMTFAEAWDKDRYYKIVYQDEALPLSIEEHTAQLSSKKAREIQGAFIKGDVNVLSCTTTFELGVDVGDLRAIFMRNVPPSTANYTQRAGRVGRRAGKPGYAITFARLRPHDIAHFEDPAMIISGETRVPVCYLDNAAIAIRHVFAVAMSEFFRDVREKHGVDYSRIYNDFADLSVEEPNGLRELRRYLAARPKAVERQLERVVPSDLPVSGEIGIADWEWASLLVGEPDEGAGREGGRLVLAHNLKHADYARVQEGIEVNQEVDDTKASSLLRARGALKKEKTISVLAENGILPKYGFPTDLVELHLPAVDQSVEENRLSLSRGMRQAIREYAPGSKIVAGKTLWESIGIKKPKGQELKARRYGKCPECDAFVWPIENYSDTGECPVCHAEVTLEKRMLIPSYGFVGARDEKGIGFKKPRSKGYVDVHFSQHWPHEAKTDHVSFGGGRILKRYAGNGHLCVMNAPRAGFLVCSYCSAAAVGDQDVKHLPWCERQHSTRYNALGTDFVSDVLELVFEIEDAPFASPDDWEATMWSIFTAAAKILEIPETELGGTIYENEMHSISIMIYDNVPGGAGHALQLNDMVAHLIETAYSVVDGHCGCGEETCCYGCIANYYNQMKQAKLSRGAAKRILGALLNVDRKHATAPDDTRHPDIRAGWGVGGGEEALRADGFSLWALDEGASLGALSFSDACSRAVSTLSSDEWRSLIEEIAHLGVVGELEVPDQDVEMESGAGKSAFAALVWRSAKIVLLDEEGVEDFRDTFGDEWRFAVGWRIFEVGKCTAREVLEALERG